VVMGDEDVVRRSLTGLHDLGIKIALDDFGTGYSSLSYLRRFPFDKIKIDRSFVSALGTEGDTGAIIHAIVGLADALGMETVAEGIENIEQERFLHAIGVDRFQGYFYSKPLPLAEYRDFVSKIKGKSSQSVINLHEVRA
jgi:EAL domain-containing protein (putative c-di-GMP-specific phosphodiesterase class I)